MEQKLIIYQVFPRIFTNENPSPRPWGSIEENSCGKMNHITGTVLESIRSLGVNAVWYTGIIEHATKTSFEGIPSDNSHVVKGEAGSPYAIKDYYDVSPSLAEDVAGRMEEFESLIRRTHKASLKAIIDFVPNHTARRYHSDVEGMEERDFGAGDNLEVAFQASNNYYYIPGQEFAPWLDLGHGDDAYYEYPAKATGNDCFTARCSETDWYETVKLNYGRDYSEGRDYFDPIPDTWYKMLKILMFWASKGVDGFRCDMVFMVPQEFWQWVIPQVKSKYPRLLFIGEIYEPALYGTFINRCGFDYLYDKVNLYDTLVAIEKGEAPASKITQCWQLVERVGDKMLNFLENHDEVRFASDAYAGDPIRVVPSLVVSSMLSRGPFMLYYGQELGITGEENEGFAGDNHRSTIFDYWSYDVLRRWYDGGKCTGNRLTAQERWLRTTYSRLLTLCNSRAEISKGGFYDLTYANAGNPWFDTNKQYSFVRYYGADLLLITVNFAHANVYCEVSLPAEFFDALGIAEGEVESTDLYTGFTRKMVLSPATPLRMTIGASNASILSIKAIKRESKEQKSIKASLLKEPRTGREIKKKNKN